MSLVLPGATSGSVTIDVPAVAGTNALTLPASTGTVVLDSATQTLTNKTLTSPVISGASVSAMASSVLTSGTALAATSNTSFDFTSIPSWVKRITVMFSNLSSSGSSDYIIQLGAGSVQTTGYAGGNSYVGAGTAGFNMSTGFLVLSDSSAEVSHGIATLCLLNAATGVWCMTAVSGHSNEAYSIFGGGSKTLSGTLDRVRFTTVNGTDTFDAGSINILYE